ncbi:MAG: hypothetical protein ACFE9D_08305 [Promethearchaeota archaeon]
MLVEMAKLSRVMQFMLYGMCFGLVIGSALWILTNNAFFIFIPWLIGLLVGLGAGIVVRAAD